MLNIQKLKDLQGHLDKLARQELEEGIIQSLLNNSGFDAESVTKRFKVQKDINHPARTYNHWADKNIIPPLEKGQRRKFNRIESIWVEIVITLREFGLKLEQIEKVRNQLLYDDNQKLDYSLFDYALMYSILVDPYVILVFNDATINLMSNTQYIRNLKGIKSLPPHITINLLNIAAKEFPNNNFEIINDSSKVTEISVKELQLLYYLRTGDYETIKIRIKDGEVYLLEGTKKIENTQVNSIKAINNCEFQNIEIKVKEGKVVFIESTEFKKI